MVETEQASEITRESYEAGFREYLSCMEGIGYPLQGIEEKDSVYTYLIPVDAANLGGDDCYAENFQAVDIAWQTQEHIEEQGAEARMLRQCLESLGLPAADNQRERINVLEENGYSIDSCLKFYTD